MKLAHGIGISVCLLSSVGCSKDSPARSRPVDSEVAGTGIGDEVRMKQTKSRCVAVVEAYEPDAMHDNLGDGFASFDGTRVKFESPPALAGRVTTIFHDRPPAADSPWRAVGGRIAFEGSVPDLAGVATIFAGAVTGLERVP